MSVATIALTEICTQLQDLQRQRSQMMKSRVMVGNRLRAIVATMSGYRTEWDEKAREKAFKDAQSLIDQVRKGTETATPLLGMILAHQHAVDALEVPKKALEKSMEALSRQLPVAEWALEPAQRGFGILSLAVVVGEAGDLSLYANPAKLWKRMGCAPHSFAGQTFMGATWKSGRQAKLPAEEWTAFGYSPRRRSIAYLIGDGLMKQNRTGPYRMRYDEAKASFAEKHKDEDPKLYSPKRAHLHGMLLATKRLLRELWIQWHK